MGEPFSFFNVRKAALLFPLNMGWAGGPHYQTHPKFQKSSLFVGIFILSNIVILYQKYLLAINRLYSSQLHKHIFNEIIIASVVFLWCEVCAYTGRYTDAFYRKQRLDRVLDRAVNVYPFKRLTDRW